MRYELFYWPSIQGRGEFVRLALEHAGANYMDVARECGDEESGEAMLMQWLEEEAIERPPFAPPFLKAGKLVIAQTANILLYLGTRHDLAPKDKPGRLWTHQLQLTIADFVTEIHDTHHPVGARFYYEDQKAEARRRAANFRRERLPKFLGYFERVLKRNSNGIRYMVGKKLTYVDLSMFQVMVGLRYAFPRAMSQLKRGYLLLDALSDRVLELPGISAYMNSERRLRFNNEGIFRHYGELDARSTRKIARKSNAS